MYDDADRPLAQIDALGNRSTSVFDEAGRTIATVNALGYRTSSVFDAANRLEATIDALGSRSTSVFDAAGQTIATSLGAAGPDSILLAFGDGQRGVRGSECQLTARGCSR